MQHRHYGELFFREQLSISYVRLVPITLIMAFLLPVFIGDLWEDAMGAFIWAGLVKAVWGMWLVARVRSTPLKQVL